MMSRHTIQGRNPRWKLNASQAFSAAFAMLLFGKFPRPMLVAVKLWFALVENLKINGKNNATTAGQSVDMLPPK